MEPPYELQISHVGPYEQILLKCLVVSNGLDSFETDFPQKVNQLLSLLLSRVSHRWCQLWANKNWSPWTFTDYSQQVSHYLFTIEKLGISTLQQEAQTIDFIDKIHITMVLQVLHIGSSLVLVVLYILSLSSRLSNFFFLSQPQKRTPSILILPPYLQGHFLFLSLQLSYYQLNTQGYFSLLYQFPSLRYPLACLLMDIFSVQAISDVFNVVEVR